jgi:hypothetical protein
MQINPPAVDLDQQHRESIEGSYSDEQQRLSPFALSVAVLLLASGLIHLAILALLGSTWHGPLSFRKPALFGISGGLTMWSLTWLMTQLKPKKVDRMLVVSLSLALLIEVAIITLQTWRGVASHFNHSTVIDAAIEFSMLGLILFVTVGIFYLTWRTCSLCEMEPAMAIAIRGGMGLLSLSCILGIATSVFGEASLSMGGTSEVWGRAGVLKFPHGVALHAIQILPILAWMAQIFGLKQPVRVVQAAIGAQCLFLLYAVWQTSCGRERFDWDTVGGGLLSLVAVLGLYPALAFLAQCLSQDRGKS